MQIIYLTLISLFSSLVSSEVEVYLTIAATIDELINGSGIPITSTERRIIVNWRNATANNTNDWIGLFKSNPQTADTTSLSYRKLINSTHSGHERTSEQFVVKNFTEYGVNLPDGCLNDTNGNQWYVAYISGNNNSIVAKNCFKAYPNWMQNNLQTIGNHTLRKIVIPGSHDGGCYNRWGLLSINISQRIESNENYRYCQADSIYNQLVYGIRYFDIRGGYITNESEPLQIVHSDWNCGHTLRDLLTQVKTFLDRAHKEVVIFDFHLFQKGFDDTNTTVVKQKHQLVMNLLKEVVGTYIINDTLVNYTINQLVSLNKRLVIGYVEKNKGYFSDSDNHLLWENVKHQWGDKDTVEGLESWFAANLCKDTDDKLKSAQAELTPTTINAVLDVYGGLRRMADDVNWRYRNWFLDQWWNCINIVSADFVIGSDVVNIAIEVNKRKFH